MVFDAVIVSGSPKLDSDETSAVEWWNRGNLPHDEMSDFTRALLEAVGISIEL